MSVLQKHHRSCFAYALDDRQWPLHILQFEEFTLQAELAAQAAERQQAVGDLQEQVGRLQEQVARAQVAPSPAQVHTRLHTYVCKADDCV